LALWTSELSDHESHLVYYTEPIATQQAWLSRSCPIWGRWPLESIRLTAGTPVFGGQVATGNVENGVAVQVSVRLPKIPERDALSVTQQPGRLVVERGHAFFQVADAKENTETTALEA
jgi:hypothetical protein